MTTVYVMQIDGGGIFIQNKVLLTLSVKKEITFI